MKDLFDVVHTGKVISETSREIITKYHYSKSYRSLLQKHTFELRTKEGVTKGVIVFGLPCSRRLAGNLEIRKVALIDDTPKNSESYFIGQCLRWIAKNTNYKQIITFADPNHGHKGTIYKATNFIYDGEDKSGNPRIIVYKNRRIHLRQVYQKKNGIYTANAKYIQELIARGEALVKKQKPKLRFIYNLKK